MLIINTARRYRDLDFRSMSLGLFEAESSPIDIAENLDFLLEDETSDKEITTLNDVVINRVGYLIAKGYITNDSVEVRLFENGNLTGKAFYVDNGILKDFPIGFYTMPKKEKK